MFCYVMFYILELGEVEDEIFRKRQQFEVEMNKYLFLCLYCLVLCQLIFLIFLTWRKGWKGEGNRTKNETKDREWSVHAFTWQPFPGCGTS